MRRENQKESTSAIISTLNTVVFAAFGEMEHPPSSRSPAFLELLVPLLESPVVLLDLLVALLDLLVVLLELPAQVLGVSSL